MREKLELYIHIPFCVRKCAYCDFLSFPAGTDVQRQYVNKLMEEIEMAGAGFHETAVSSVFVGGGTPSVLAPFWMEEIFERLHKCFYIEENAEISMEANPGTVSKEKLLAYRRAGINRLSFGLQSADNRELKALGRIHTWEEFTESFFLAREAGFDNLNVDLMSALPEQTEKSWVGTLEKVTALTPEHISAYSLILEEGTPFFEKYGDGRGKGILPDEDEERRMYHRTKEILKDCGYERYEISNYARCGRECRHNIGYWTGVPYLGLGLGASSYVDGRRFKNESSMPSYLKGRPGKRCEEELLSAKDMEEEFFIVGLRMVRGVCLKEFEERFGKKAEEVYPGIMEKFVKQGAAVMEDGYFKLTDYGLDVSNYIMAEFLL